MAGLLRTQALVVQAGELDVLVANLAIPAPGTPADAVSDDEWRHAFATMVDPLPRLARAVRWRLKIRFAAHLTAMAAAELDNVSIRT